MGTSKDCFEVGLFLMGMAWGNQKAEPQKYQIVAKQASLALKNLGMDTALAEGSTPPSGISDINERLKFVNERLQTLQKELKPLIEKKYETKGGYCYQTGIDVGNLMFASALTDPTKPSILKPFIDNLRASSAGIGNPKILEDFITDCSSALLPTAAVGTLSSISTKASECALILANWIDGNIHLEERPGIFAGSIPGFLEGIPYIGKGLAELLKNRKRKQRKLNVP